MSIRRWFLVAVLLGPGTAFGYTGNELLADCKDRHAATLCLGFVSGAAEGFDLGFQVGFRRGAIQVPQREANMMYCMPDGVTTVQGKDIVVQWLERNPKERHKSAVVLVLKALEEAYPCK